MSVKYFLSFSGCQKNKTDQNKASFEEVVNAVSNEKYALARREAYQLANVIIPEPDIQDKNHFWNMGTHRILEYGILFLAEKMPDDCSWESLDMFFQNPDLMQSVIKKNAENLSSYSANLARYFKDIPEDTFETIRCQAGMMLYVFLMRSEEDIQS